MDTETLMEKIAGIRQARPSNLMARHFDAEYYRTLAPEMQTRLQRIIASGLANPDSSMGAYAMSPGDYDDFAPYLDCLIRDFHGVPAEASIHQPHDWNTGCRACDLGAIDARLRDVSMRVRVARNIADFPLAGAMTRAQRLALERIAVKAFETLSNAPGFGGRYLSITPGSPYEMGESAYLARVAAHQMFKDMSNDRFLKVAGISNDWPHGRGMYVSQDEDFLVWVGEEDHLRIMAMQRGGDLNRLFARLHEGLSLLEKLLPEFAMSEKYGAIASCPTNLGAGMRASLHMKLPRLTNGGRDMRALEALGKTHGLAIRGAGGEHSAAGADGLVDISPTARLGISEMQIMGRLYDGAAALWAQETV